MAERMQYQVPPTRTEPTAKEALDTLLESLHEHGFLRLANDLVRANSDIGKILAEGLNKPGSQNAIQNFSLLFMMLSTIPPERMNHLLLALKAGVMAVKPASDEAKQDSAAPGIRGVVKLLNDEDLWQGLRPIFAGVEAFTREMHKEEVKPITRYSGKASYE
ncbi:DUF1641 domain-containing protein [Pantoea sp.]|uniref:DUF1641 domain-containing protein n=1 Tax=Pantoea sp. TaxID=69393 RepID=UPI00289DB5E1|nr:DUF1641 domain-containing protein [Pantoea sp.]